EDGIRDLIVTGVQTCALPILREAASMTGVARMPRGWMLPQGAAGPLLIAGAPTFLIQTTAPVVSSSAKTLFAVVAAKNTPLPPRSEERRVGKECRSRRGAKQR